MRDLTTENELEAKKKIEALEKELDLSSDLQGISVTLSPHHSFSLTCSLPWGALNVGDLDNMAVELEESEAKVEELKAQLDAAAEAQDMLEELTDRNMKLQDVRFFLFSPSRDKCAKLTVNLFFGGRRSIGQ